jgi:hypothetical protein
MRVCRRRRARSRRQHLRERPDLSAWRRNPGVADPGHRTYPFPQNSSVRMSRSARLRSATAASLPAIALATIHPCGVAIDRIGRGTSARSPKHSQASCLRAVKCDRAPSSGGHATARAWRARVARQRLCDPFRLGPGGRSLGLPSARLREGADRNRSELASDAPGPIASATSLLLRSGTSRRHRVLAIPGTSIRG